jgi:DNA-nicking Smr family endonuclease
MSSFAIINNGVNIMQQGKHSSEEYFNQPFKDLKKLIKKKRKKTMNISAQVTTISGSGALSRPCTGQIKDISISDEAVFNEAMIEVQEIKEFRDIPVQQKKTSSTCKYKNTSSDQEALKSLEELVKGRGMINLSDTQEYIEWIDQDYHKDITEKLHKGQYSVQDCLDLHGNIIEDAEKEVEHFFKTSIKKGYRCIKIIHGRGLRSVKGPVLKKALTTWLLGRYRKKIIAFVTARQCDGGLGALYVLLR